MVQPSQSQDDETGDGTTGNLCCHVLKFNKKTFFSHSTRLSVSIIFFISVHHAFQVMVFCGALLGQANLVFDKGIHAIRYLKT